jgi:TPR repeat protein
MQQRASPGKHTMQQRASPGKHTEGETDTNGIHTAALNGHPGAQCQLGNQHANSRDHVQAAVWWQRSAEQGHTSAQYNLSLCFLEGRGVAQDLVQAAIWCQKAFSARGAKRVIGSIVLKAAETGDLACLQQFHKDGTSLARVCTDGGCPMHAAVANGHLAIVKWLHEQGLDAAAEMDDGFTPAIIASQRGDMKMLRLLQEIGVDLWAKNSMRHTACDCAKDSAIKEYLTAGAPNSGSAGSTNQRAVQVTRELLKQATDGNPDAQFHLGRLHWDAQDYDQAAVRFQQSAVCGFPQAQFRLARCYLEGAGVSKNLMLAAKWCQKVFSTQGANGIGELRGLIHAIVMQAAAAGNLACLQQIQKEGVPIKFCDNDGETAMHVAANYGHLPIVKWLHEHGFDPAAPTDKGFTPAIIASSRGDVNLLRFLDDIGVDLWAKNKSGRTASDFAKAETTNELLRAVSAAKGTAVVKAVVETRKLAESGQPAAQFAFGRILEHGQGVDKNMVDAALWYRKSALQGNRSAQIRLAFCYLDGDGIARDPEEGVRWYQKACHGQRRFDDSIKNVIGKVVQSGSLESLKQLQAVITPSTADFGSGCTIMHVAAEKGQLGPMKWLHAHLKPNSTAILTSEDRDGWTPAIIASREGNVLMLKWMHEVGVDLLAKNSLGKVACDFAKKVGKSSRLSVTATYLSGLAAVAEASRTAAAADDAMKALLEDEDVTAVPKPASAGSSKQKKKNKTAAAPKKAAAKAAASSAPQEQPRAAKPAAAVSATPEQQRIATAAAAKKDKKKKNKAERTAKAAADQAEADQLAAAKDAEDYEAMVFAAQRQAQQQQEEEAEAEAEVEKEEALSLVHDAQQTDTQANPPIAPTPTVPPTPPMPPTPAVPPTMPMPTPTPVPSPLPPPAPPVERSSVSSAAATAFVAPDHTIPGLTGLSNPRGSNSCFLNSVVQVRCVCRAHTPPDRAHPASRAQLSTLAVALVHAWHRCNTACMRSQPTSASTATSAVMRVPAAVAPSRRPPTAAKPRTRASCAASLASSRTCGSPSARPSGPRLRPARRSCGACCAPRLRTRSSGFGATRWKTRGRRMWRCWSSCRWRRRH